MKGYLIRERYLERIRAGRDDTDVIKVITGMRRSGKSVILEQYKDELMASGVDDRDIIHINFERPEYQDITDKDQLNGFLMERIPRDRTAYILFDEIQNVDGWELALSGLNALGNCDVYVTGSNSDLLSSQLATHIAGRHVEIRIFPLSFKEFIDLNSYGDREDAFDRYLRLGGLPGIDPSRDDRYVDDYLEGVYNTIVLKDVVRHLNVSDPVKVESISRFLFSNIGNITNKSTISKMIGLPESTVNIYLKAMEEAFLIQRCDRYDMVGKRLLRSNNKYYVTDLGIRRAVLDISAGSDISRPLENIVYIELLRRGYKVRTGSYRDSEVDFVAVKGDVAEYYQVCQTLMSDGTRDRETRFLLRPKDNYPKTILTLDRFGLGNEDGVIIRNVLDWLMDE